MTIRPDIHSAMRHLALASERWPLGIAVIAGALFGIGAGWATWQLPPGTYPAWMLLGAPVLGLAVLLIGLLNYDLLVLITFGSVGFVWFEPAAFDLLLVMALGLGLVTGRLRWPSPKTRTVVHVGLWGVVVTNVLSAVVVVPLGPNLRFLGVTLYVLAVFCFVRMYVTDEASAGMVLTGYVASAVVNVVVVILGFTGFDLPMSVVRYSVRAAGFFKDPNVYGPFVLVAVLWLSDQILQRPFSVSRTGSLLVLTGLLAAGAILSLSRAVWINLAFSGFLYFALLVRRASRPDIARFCVLAAGVLVIALVALQLWGLGEVMTARWRVHAYDDARFAIQKLGIVAGLTHPIGVGPGRWPNAHSLYVRTLAEQGVLGLASLGLLIGGLMMPLVLRAWREQPQTAILSDRVIVACIGGQLINSVVIDSIHWRHLWILLGLAWAALAMRGGE